MSRRSATGWDEAVGVKKRGKYAAETLGWVLGEYRRSPSYQNLKPATKKAYEQAFDKLHAYGNEPLSGLRRAHILRIRDSLSSTPAIANSVLTVISVICNFALDREIIDVDPSQRIKRLKIGEWRRWTDDELTSFYERTYEAMRRVLVFALFTGQRRSDLCRAVWSDIEGGAIRVVQQKTGAKLWVPIHPTLERHISEWRSEKTVTVTILANSRHQPWSPSILSTVFANETVRLGMGGCTIHGLRKTAAAKLAEAGCSTRQIMAITGHSSLSEVERYTREADQRRLANDAMDMLKPVAFKTGRNAL